MNSRGEATFSRPSPAAFKSIIFRRNRMCVSPRESSSAFTFSIPTRSIMMLVAELSLTEIISAGSQRVGNAAATDEVALLQSVKIREFQFALLRLAVQLGQDRNLDGAGVGKHFIRVKQIFLSGGEIEDGYRKHAVKIAIHITDGRFQLLPQNLLFLSRSTFL